MIYTKKAVICDLDGTLVKSPGLHKKAWKTMFAKYSISLTESELDEQSGKKNVAFIQLILKRRNRTDLNPHELSNEKDALVIDILLREPAQVYQGVTGFFKRLHANDIKIILATSATRKTAALLAYELLSFFDAAIFAEDVQNGKPNPEIFLTAAMLFDLQPSECVVFEDAFDGVAAAKQGGFLCVARDNGERQDLSAADAIVTEYDPEDLMDYLR